MKKIILLVGLIGLISPIGFIQATTIIEGDLIRASGTLDVYIIKFIGAKKFKRLILNPAIFNQYGHLKWENVKDVSSEVLRSEYTVSDLVRAVDDEKVYKLYPNGDVGEKRWIKTADDFLDLGYDWDAIYNINNFERDVYVIGEDLEAPKLPEEEEEEEEEQRDSMTINVPADYSTIQAALDASIDGDTISVAVGTYNENITISKGIKLIGEAVGSIIDGGGNDNAITINSGTDILIHKLTVKSEDKYGIYCVASPAGGQAITATIKINFIKSSGWGIVADGNCQLTILNNLIYNNKHSTNTDGAGILIKNNFSHGITSEIRNNTIDDNYHGIWSEDANLKVMNNIITNNIGGKGTVDSIGIYHSGEGEFDNTYNDVYGNGYNFEGDAMPGSGSIIENPDFLNAYIRNYRLKFGSTDYSPCLDRGHPDMIYYDAVYTSNTTRNDMGAYGGPENISW